MILFKMMHETLHPNTITSESDNIFKGYINQIQVLVMSMDNSKCQQRKILIGHNVAIKDTVALITLTRMETIIV